MELVVSANVEGKEREAAAAPAPYAVACYCSAMPTRPKNEKPVCDFVSRILSVETGEPIECRRDCDQPSAKKVEELWTSPTHRFAIEHTLLESFTGQIRDDAALDALIAPIEAQLLGRLPGTYTLTIDAGAASDARVPYRDAHRWICDAVLTAAPSLPVGKRVTLNIEHIPTVHIHRRGQEGSKVIVRRQVSDVEPSRLERVKQALADKCPKLSLAARRHGGLSILALESHDILAGADVVICAVQAALYEREDQPDLVMLIETDMGPFCGWVIRNATEICLTSIYTDGEF